ncbi:MAG: hypothetical protein Q9169_007606 [Polycauliona sp. 2 TL-2023]
MTSSKALGLDALLQQAATARVDCRTVCGPKAAIVYSATNLYGSLRRLRQEGDMARSSLNTPTVSIYEIWAALGRKIALLLKETSEFLIAYKTLGFYEDKILGSWEFASFTEAQKSIIRYFDAELMESSHTVSSMLITASAESLGELRDQLDHETGLPLSPALDDLTVRLMANGDVRLSMLVKGPGNEQILWEALQYELVEMSVDKALLDRHKKIILRYVRALERRSGFSGNFEKSPDNAAQNTEKGQKSGAKRRSLGNEDDVNGKRARTSRSPCEESQHPHASGRAHSATTEAGSSFRFRDPRVAFGPDVNDDLLADFLEEEDQPSQESSLRTQIRDVYSILCDEYEPKYEMTMFFETDKKGHDEKQIAGLIHDIEKRVVMKLDNLGLGQDTSLRDLRKMIIIKAQKMLDDLEKIMSK